MIPCERYAFFTLVRDTSFVTLAGAMMMVGASFDPPLAFKVGAKLWMEARAAWRESRGADARLADFHREALALGPMGLAPLRAQLLAG